MPRKKMNVLIATSCCPVSEEGFNQFCETIETSAKQGDLMVSGIYWTEGPGCSNLAIAYEGDEAEIENHANQITMALMPSKWGTTSDVIEDGRKCRLNKLSVN